MLGAVGWAAGQHPPGPGHPAAPAGQLAPVEQAEGHPEGAPGGPLGLAPGQQLLVGPGPGLGALVVPPDQEGGGGQPLQVVGLQRRRLVGRRQPFVGVGPRLPGKGRPALVQRVGHGPA